MSIQIPDYKNDWRLSVATRKFLTTLNQSGLPPLETLGVEAARGILSRVQQSGIVEKPTVEESEKILHTSQGEVKITIVRKKKRQQHNPAFLFIHGGGWALGDYPTHRRLVCDLVTRSACTGIFVHYSRTPEHIFPTQINEIYAVLEWLEAHGRQIFIDASRIAVVGNSVGGNMATVTCMLAKDNNGPDIKLQVLMLPVVSANFQTNSYKSYGKERFLTSEMMEWMYRMYLPGESERVHPYASPLMATIPALSGLPPALIQVAENDILRDDAEAYGQRLDSAGVKVTTVRYSGTIHDFSLLDGLAHTPQSLSLLRHAGAELNHHLIACP